MCCVSFINMSMESMKIVEENGVKLRISQDNQTPEKSDVFFNPKIKINRELVLCGLSVYLDQHKQYATNPARCLDAFAASGALGLQWQKHLTNEKLITLNDIKPTTVQNIRFNCKENDVKVCTFDGMTESWKPESPTRGSDGDCKENDINVTTSDRMEDGRQPSESDRVEIVCQDANILLLERAFDFVHLDPFGTAVHHLESAFRNTPNKGIVSITSTDLASVYGRCPRMTKRHYSAHVIRSEYYREMAARLIIGAVARAAARCNKGIDVLLSVAYEHFILVMVRVVRGPQHADHSVDKVQRVIHCLICGERCFVPGNHSVESNYYTLLKCKCKHDAAGKTAVFLGPVWSGSIFKADFIHRMLQCASQLKLSSKVTHLLKTLHIEAVCSETVEYPTLKQPCVAENVDQRSTPAKCGPATSPSADTTLTSTTADELRKAHEGTQQQVSDGVKRPCEQAFPPAKRTCQEGNQETPAPAPSFYYNIHLHTAKGKDSLKIKKVIQLLKENGYRASRTHFDPVAVRTDAKLHEFLEILTSNSLPTSRPTV